MRAVYGAIVRGVFTLIFFTPTILFFLFQLWVWSIVGRWIVGG